MRKTVILGIGVLGAILACVMSPQAGGVPRPDGNGKTYVFPDGRYVLAGGKEAAVGEDVTELMSDFTMRPGQYILSGGPNPTDEIIVDDDLEILQGGKSLFVDNDRIDSRDKRGQSPATYQRP